VQIIWSASKEYSPPRYNIILQKIKKNNTQRLRTQTQYLKITNGKLNVCRMVDDANYEYGKKKTLS